MTRNKTCKVTLGVLAGAFCWAGDAAAQSALCPSTAAQVVMKTQRVCVSDGSTGTICHDELYPVYVTYPGVELRNGQCTNNGRGNPDPAAFSGAALASQALSELSQSASQETARSAENSISKRREEERERCAEGFTRVDGVCERVPAPVAEASAPPPPAKKAAAKKKKPRRAVAEVEVEPPPPPPAPHPVLVSKDGPPPPIEAPFRYGVWGNVFGEYEKRNASGFGAISGPDFNAGAPVPLNINVDSQTGTVGFQAGLDFTARSLFGPNDGAIVGVLVGYLNSTLNLNTTAQSTMPGVVGNASTHLNAQLEGPTMGLYGTYFSGPFSADLLTKFDILSLDQNFTDNLAFAGPAGPFGNTFSNSGSTSVLVSTVAANLNYRFDLAPGWWLEPTVGAQFTALGYGGGGAALGLENGNQVMVQGGARIGNVAMFDRVVVKTTLTGLAYSDVAINGGFIPGASFNGNNILANADEGQVRGRGILAFNFDCGQGLSSFILGDVHGGKGLFGAGGKAGIRYEW